MVKAHKLCAVADVPVWRGNSAHNTQANNGGYTNTL